MLENEEEQTRSFEYCGNVDLHALDLQVDLNKVVAIAAEHGFRGIVVTLGRIDELVKAIQKPVFGDERLIPICAIDYPYGSSSTDVRTYSVMSAKEKGAREVEIVIPYHLVVAKDLRAIFNDVQSVMNAAKKSDISVKYVIDQNSHYLDDGARTTLCRVMARAKVPIISTSLGFFDEKINHSDAVIRMRNLKNKVGCGIKVYVGTNDPNELALYPKAGADVIGVNWINGPFLVHAYEDIVQKKS